MSHWTPEHGQTGQFYLRTITRDNEDVRQLKCPKCGVWADLDDDQYHGRVSVHHDDPSCGYHETHDFSAMDGRFMG